MLFSNVTAYNKYQFSFSNFKWKNTPLLATRDPSSSFAEKVVNAIMSSPLYTPIVKVARSTMVKTAESVGLEWKSIADGLLSINDWKAAVHLENASNIVIPKYYRAPFHGYADGNLCLQAAVEQEIAGKAVGARNFPSQGLQGESALRRSYADQLARLGVVITPGERLLDMGCGTGTSTRRLAELYPQAGSIIGLDLSPHMVAVGRYLQGGSKPGLHWVEEIVTDSRIELVVGDIASTGLSENSVQLVSLCLVLHELPQEATRRTLCEAWRVLKPGGFLTIMEMDPDAPGYRKLRANPWLFSVLRSTEPYLDEYFTLAPLLPKVLSDIGFPVVRIAAATGRHLALVAVKGGIIDARPSEEEREKADEHINTPLKTTAYSTR
jgi:ubiquinone/menaquinone biosynthesis C-methylase UbiE